MDPETNAETCSLLQDLMIDWDCPAVADFAAANAGKLIPELGCVLVRHRAQELLAQNALRSTSSLIYAGAYALARLTVGSETKAPVHSSTRPLLVHKAATELGDEARAQVRRIVDENWDDLRDGADPGAGPQ